MDKLPKKDPAKDEKARFNKGRIVGGLGVATVAIFMLGRCSADSGDIEPRADVEHSNNTPGQLNLEYTGSPQPWTTGPMFTANNPRPSASPTDTSPSISPFASNTLPSATKTAAPSISKPNSAKTCEFTRTNPAPLVGNKALLLEDCTTSHEVAYPKGGGTNIRVEPGDSITITCQKTNFVEGTLTYANGTLNKSVSLPLQTIGYPNMPTIPECK